MNVILPLINVAGIIGDAIMRGVYWILLLIDGVVYNLVAYSFKIFQLMCTVNFNSIYNIARPLVDRLQAVIIVFVVYLLAVNFITFLLNPDKALDGGKKFLKNLFIATALFISYNFIFSMFNELNIALMGNSTGYKYTTLAEVFDLTEADGNGAKDEGLIMRFIFRKTNIEDPGQTIAVSLAGIFIRDHNRDTSSIMRQSICNAGKCEFHNLKKNLPSEIVDDKVDYSPIIGFIVCLFVIYSMFSASLQIGVRMFKLLILQMLAPIVIVDVLKNGMMEGKFKTFCQKYISIFLEAFIRMLTILIITVFVSQFLVHIGDYFPTLQSEESGITKFIIMVIIVLAAYTFAGQVPKFIDEVIGTHMGDSAKGNLLGGLLGGAAGAITGAIGGAAAGGFRGAISGLGTGAVGGAAAGSKGEKISDLFKAGRDNLGKGIESGARTRELRSNWDKSSGYQKMFGAGLGYGIASRLGLNEAHNARVDARKAAEENALKDAFKADPNHRGLGYDDYIEAEEHARQGYENNLREVTDLENLIETEAEGTGYTYGGTHFDWNSNEEDVIATDSAYQTACAHLEGLQARREAMLQKNRRANTSTIDAQIAAASTAKAQTHQAAANRLQATKDAVRDNIATHSANTEIRRRASVAGNATVADRKTRKQELNRNITERSEHIREARDRKYQDEKRVSDMDKQKVK